MYTCCFALCNTCIALLAIAHETDSLVHVHCGASEIHTQVSMPVIIVSPYNAERTGSHGELKESEGEIYE